MVPSSAIVLKKNRKGQGLVELYDIDKGNLVDPRHLTPENIADLRNSLEAEKDTSLEGIVPEGTIYLSGTAMAFEIPRSERYLFIGNDKDNRSVKRWLPDMVFLYRGPDHQLDVYWSKGKENLLQTYDDPVLIAAPMPNINGARVCLGDSMKMCKYTPDIKVMQNSIVKTFFGSLFNEWRTPAISAIMDLCKQRPAKLKEFWNSKPMIEHSKSNRWKSVNEALQQFTGRTQG